MTKHTRIILLSILLLIVLSLMVPIANWVTLQRMRNDLTSPHSARRAAAIRYWLNPDDLRTAPRLFSDEAALDRLRDAAPTASVEMLRSWMSSFGNNLRWTQSLPDVHVHALKALFDERPGDGNAIGTLGQLRRLPARLAPSNTAALLELLLLHSGEDIHPAILRHALRLLGTEAEPLLAAHLDDRDGLTARTAWLGLAMLDPPDGYSANWREVPPQVGEAVLIASAWTNPESRDLLIAQVTDAARDAELAAALNLLRNNALSSAQDVSEAPRTRAPGESAIPNESWWRTALELQQLDQPVRDARIRELLISFNERDKRLGAVAAGYHWVHLDLLLERDGIADDPVTRAAHRGGLLLAGILSGPEVDRAVRGMTLLAEDGTLDPLDVMFILVGGGESEEAFTWLLEPLNVGPLQTTWRRSTIADLGPCLSPFLQPPINGRTPNDEQSTTLALDIWRMWWLVLGPDLQFNDTSRRYDLLPITSAAPTPSESATQLQSTTDVD